MDSHKICPKFYRFNGDSNPKDWVFHAEQYFAFYKILPEHQLSLASFYLDGAALSWYRWLFRNQQLEGWNHFVDKLFLRFRNWTTNTLDGCISIPNHVSIRLAVDRNTLYDFLFTLKQQLDDLKNALSACSENFSGAQATSVMVAPLEDERDTKEVVDSALDSEFVDGISSPVTDSELLPMTNLIGNSSNSIECSPIVASTNCIKALDTPPKIKYSEQDNSENNATQVFDIFPQREEPCFVPVIRHFPPYMLSDLPITNNLLSTISANSQLVLHLSAKVLDLRIVHLLETNGLQRCRVLHPNGVNYFPFDPGLSKLAAVIELQMHIRVPKIGSQLVSNMEVEKLWDTTKRKWCSNFKVGHAHHNNHAHLIPFRCWPMNLGVRAILLFFNNCLLLHRVIFAVLHEKCLGFIAIWLLDSYINVADRAAEVDLFPRISTSIDSKVVSCACVLKAMLSYRISFKTSSGSSEAKAISLSYDFQKENSNKTIVFDPGGSIFVILIFWGSTRAFEALLEAILMLSHYNATLIVESFDPKHFKATIYGNPSSQLELSLFDFSKLTKLSFSNTLQFLVITGRQLLQGFLRGISVSMSCWTWVNEHMDIPGYSKFTKLGFMEQLLVPLYTSDYCWFYSVHLWDLFRIINALLTFYQRFGDSVTSWDSTGSDVDQLPLFRLELRNHGGEMFVFWQKADCYGKVGIFNNLEGLASQSPLPYAIQPQRQCYDILHRVNTISSRLLVCSNLEDKVLNSGRSIVMNGPNGSDQAEILGPENGLLLDQRQPNKRVLWDPGKRSTSDRIKELRYGVRRVMQIQLWPLAKSISHPLSSKNLIPNSSRLLIPFFLSNCCLLIP